MRRTALVAACVGLVALAACGDGRPAAPTATTATATPAPAVTTPVTPPPPAPAPPHDAWVDVAVANLWAAPDQARPLDAPSLSNPVDVPAWLAAMTVDDRRWLIDRLVTQALYGDRVTVIDTAGAWARVVVPRQPSSLDPRGYPGWLPAAQLTTVPPAAARAGDAIVTRPSATLHRPGASDLELSFDTRLPVLGIDAEAGVTVSTPGGGLGRLDPAAVAVLTPKTLPATGADVVRSAQLFSGVAYLWAGTSGRGWDCSGLTSAAYGAHGVVIPRDADDQAAAGTPVERSDLRPGDLLFFGESSVTHVGMYVGDGRMIQAPATGRSVETVPVDSPGLNARYRGARRYLPSE